MLDPWLTDEDVPEITGEDPLASLFPKMSSDDYTAHSYDMKKNGQREPVVVMPDGLLLDGRNRRAAWLQGHRLGSAHLLVVKFIGSDGTASRADALTYVFSKNGARRHLTASQRAMVAARLKKLTKASQDVRARQNSVSSKYVEYADKVLKSGDAALIAEVDRGSLSLATAAKKLEAAKVDLAKPSVIEPTERSDPDYVDPDGDPDDPGFTTEIIGERWPPAKPTDVELPKDLLDSPAVAKAPALTMEALAETVIPPVIGSKPLDFETLKVQIYAVPTVPEIESLEELLPPVFKDAKQRLREAELRAELQGG